MGQTNKSDCGNKKDKGKKKDEAPSPTPTTMVMKVDMHCDGCASKIVKCLRGFQGVESLKVESEIGKLTITGKVDPAKLRDKLTSKMKKNVDTVFPLIPNKDNENKSKDNDKKSKDKEPLVTTTVLNVSQHCQCQGCYNRIRKAVLKTKGIYGVGVDKGKGVVMVNGTMDVKALVGKLSKKFKRKVEVVPPKKEKEKEKKKEKGKEKEKEKDKEGEKESEKGGNAAAKKKKKGGGDGEGGSGGGGDNDKGEEGGGDGKGKTEQNFIDYTIPGYGYGYGYGDSSNYIGPYHASQMFSDENPYACHIM